MLQIVFYIHVVFFILCFVKFNKITRGWCANGALPNKHLQLAILVILAYLAAFIFISLTKYI